jgi:hypothetical protein
LIQAANGDEAAWVLTNVDPPIGEEIGTAIARALR